MKLQEIINAKIAVHCPTKEEAEKVASIFATTGKHYRTLDSGISCYADEICLTLKNGHPEYADKQFHIEGDYTIISAKQFIEANISLTENWMDSVHVMD